METYKFELTFKEITLIIRGLKKIPYDKSSVILKKIITSYEDQLKNKQL